MKKTLLLCLLAGWFFPVIAQLTRWPAGAGHLDMGKQVSILEDKQGTLTIDAVTTANPSQFTQSTQSILHFGFTQSIFWLNFTLDNPSKDSLLLELDHAFIPTADLYTRDASGHWVVQRAGFHVPLGNKTVINAAQVFPLPAGRHDFYLRLQPYVHAFPVTLWEKSHFHVKASREKLIYGTYAGLLLFAIAINLFLFYTFRRGYYLNYAVLVFFYILSSALVMEGYAVYFFPEIDLMFWYRLVPVLDMPALLFYCLAFLEVKRYDPRLHRIGQWICAALLVYIVVLEFLPLLPVLVINQLLALGVFILAITIGLRTGRKGNKLGYYFVTAYSIWFVLINLELVYIQTGKPPHLGSISYVSLAIFIESFLLAWLLIQRFRWEKQEDQRRQADMQAHINKMHREFQHAILSSKLEIQEQTFQQISQEIHDNIGQILSLVKLHIATMEPAGNAILENKIKESKTLVTKAIHDLRNLSHRLNTGYINDVGFDSAVKSEMETIRRSGVYEIKFTVEGRPSRFDPQKELILFRIVQELLNNILKHARAKTISVELNYNREGLLVMIQDDGQGFDRSTLDSPSPDGGAGLGIKSMYHRASLIGADFQLTSSVGSGTVAAIHIAHQTVHYDKKRDLSGIGR
ncbi:MAG TPA: 7TM-DISM domain-containing protein [Puia sp.]|jgi:two-component system NarL family sensor kinase|nr:7TM-DISM domain-containing protein [Puia sp.]